MLEPMAWKHLEFQLLKQSKNITIIEAMGHLLFQKEGTCMSKNNNQHVTHRPDGMWQVKGAGNSRATVVTSTQKQSIEIAKRIATNKNSEVVIHGRDGKIREKNSYGNDPFPPRG